MRHEVPGGLQGAVGGHRAPAVRARPPRQIRERAPGLADQDRSRGDIPGIEAALVEGVDAPGGHIGQVHGGTASTPDVADPGNYLDEASRLPAPTVRVVAESGRHECL